MINEGLPLVDTYIEGYIQIIGNDKWDKEITFKNCIIEFFDGTITQFGKPVKFINTHFKKCRFTFSYFLEGLTIENCVFDDDLDFQAGGHNQIGHSISIKRNTFSGFVNFFDCSFNGDVYINNNAFLKGTNIESQKQMISFDTQPVVINNTGQTNIEAESAN